MAHWARDALLVELERWHGENGGDVWAPLETVRERMGIGQQDFDAAVEDVQGEYVLISAGGLLLVTSDAAPAGGQWAEEAAEPSSEVPKAEQAITDIQLRLPPTHPVALLMAEAARTGSRLAVHGDAVVEMDVNGQAVVREWRRIYGVNIVP